MRAADTRDAIECWEQTLVDCQSGPLRPRFPHSYDQHCTAVSGSREESGFGGACVGSPSQNLGYLQMAVLPPPAHPSIQLGWWERTALPTNRLSKKVELRRNELNSRILIRKIRDTLQGFSGK